MSCSRAALLSSLTVIACALTATAAAPASAAAPTFGPENIVGSVGVPSKVVKANFNSDAYDDALVVLEESAGMAAVYVYVGSANGLVHVNSLSAVTDGAFTGTAADVNGDGQDEAIITSYNGGSFHTRIEAFDLGPTAKTQEGHYSAFYPDEAVSDLVAGDFVPGDGAGRELAVRGATNPVQILDLVGDSLNVAGEFVAQAGPLGVIDYDTTPIPADGADDVLIGATGFNQTAVAINDGSGSAFDYRTDLTPGETNTVGFARGDLDGDGRNDYVSTSKPDPFDHLHSEHFSRDSAYSNGTGIGGLSTSFSGVTVPAVGDYSADRTDDSVVFTDYNATIFSYSSIGSAQRTTFSINIPVLAAAAVDVSGDGMDDLVAARSDGNLAIYYAMSPDTTAPHTTIVSAPPTLTSSTSASFQFVSDEADSTFQCNLDNTGFMPCASPRSYSGLSAGQHTFAVRAVDAAANIDPTPATYTWTVDVTAPQTTIASAPANPTSSTSATFAFSSDDSAASFQCSLDNAGFVPCASPRDYSGLSAGQHTFAVRAVDAASNVDPTPATRTWTVDLTAPQTTIASAPANPTGSTSATFEFSSDDVAATFECRLDDSAFAPCASAQDYSGLSGGEHTFAVRAIDAASNVDLTPDAYTWTVDTTAPQTTIDAGPEATVSSESATFEFSSDDSAATFQCRLDDGAFIACSSPQTYNELSDGEHTFAVRATDSLGNANTTATQRTWTVDTTAPDTSLDAGPAAVTNSASATFEFSSAATDGVLFRCSLDGAQPTACTSPKTITGLDDGEHTYTVVAFDGAGNADQTPASVTWTVDTDVPNTTIDSGPSGVTNATSATFEFSSAMTAATFECRLDSGAFAACMSAKSYEALSSGEHTFAVRATRNANTDQTPATRTWTVDTSAPAQPALIAGPQDTSSSRTATFEFTGEAGSTFECSLDGVTLTPCTSPVTYDGLADGAHTFSVRQIDSAGNAGATSVTAFAVKQPADTTPPTPTVPTPEPTAPTEPVLKPVVADASRLRVVVARRGTLRNGAVDVGCRLDAGALASCSVRAYANNVRVGAGARTFTGDRLGAVRVKLTARGRRLVRRVGGVRLTYRTSATTAAAKTLRASAISRVLPLRATAVPTDGVFATGSTRLTAAGKRYVKALAADVGGARRVVCTGHTDSVGRAQSNRRLGFARAKTVCAVLRSAGVGAQLHSQSAGESQRRASNRTARGRALNRRVELTVSYR